MGCDNHVVKIDVPYCIGIMEQDKKIRSGFFAVVVTGSLSPSIPTSTSAAIMAPSLHRGGQRPMLMLVVSGHYKTYHNGTVS
jgi:hypothetical protein